MKFTKKLVSMLLTSAMLLPAYTASVEKGKADGIYARYGNWG